MLYERADGTFAAGLLLKPSSENELAPLLMLEVEPDSSSDSGVPIPVVHEHVGSVEILGERYEQRIYFWGSQGLRVTLGRDGFPAVYEVLSDSSGARLLFVTENLEGAAASDFGDPLEGRRFAVERRVEAAPQAVVAGILEPGPVPLGPFVYLTRSGDVASVICRCMESRVETVVDSLEYELRPLEEVPPQLKELPSGFGFLRLPVAAL